MVAYTLNAIKLFVIK